MSPVRWAWGLMRLCYHVRAPPIGLLQYCAHLLPLRGEISVRHVVWPMVVFLWNYNVRQPFGSRCVVVSGHCLRLQLGPHEDPAAMVYGGVGCRSVPTDFAFVLLADVFTTYTSQYWCSAFLAYLEAYWNRIHGLGTLG